MQRTGIPATVHAVAGVLFLFLALASLVAGYAITTTTYALLCVWCIANLFRRRA